MSAGPVVKTSKVRLIAFAAGVVAWMSAWLLVQELGGIRTLGPITVFSVMTLPAVLLPGAAWARGAPPERRAGRVALVALAAALALAAPPLFGLLR